MLSMIRESYHQIMLKPVYWMIANTDKNTRWVKIMVEKSGYKWLNGGGKRNWGLDVDEKIESQSKYM